MFNPKKCIKSLCLDYGRRSYRDQNGQFCCTYPQRNRSGTSCLQHEYSIFGDNFSAATLLAINISSLHERSAHGLLDRNAPTGGVVSFSANPGVGSNSVRARAGRDGPLDEMCSAPCGFYGCLGGMFNRQEGNTSKKSRRSFVLGVGIVTTRSRQRRCVGSTTR